VQTYTIRQILVFIVAAMLLPAFVMALAFSLGADAEERARSGELSQLAARAVLLDVDGEFRALSDTALALASSPALASADLRAFHQQQRQMLARLDGADLVLAAPDGRQLLDARAPFGSALPRHADPALLARAAAGTAPLVSDLYAGAAAAPARVSVCAPVRRDGATPYLLAIDVAPARFSALLARHRLPPQWLVAVIDGAGHIVARSRDEARFVGRQVTPALRQRLAAADEGRAELSTLDGVPVYTAFSRSRQSGWSVAVGVPTAAALASLSRSLSLALAALGALLLAGLALAGAAARHVHADVGALVRLAAGVGRGEQPEAPPLRLAEAGYVAAALARAAAMLARSERERDAAEAALRGSNAELEQRVLQRTAALDQSRHLLDSVIEHMPAMVVVKHGPQLRYELLNHAGELLLGLPRGEVIGKTDQEILPPQAAAARLAAERRVLASGELAEIEQEELRTARGATRYLHTKMIALHNGDDVERLLAISLDITDSKAAAEQLRVVAVAFDSQEPMMITDAAGVVLRVNPAFSACTGYAPGEILGRTPRLLKSERHDAAFYAAMWQAIGRDGVWQGEIWARRKNGEVYPTWTIISAIRDQGGALKNYVCAQTDISARKRAEEDIRQLAFYDPLTKLPNRRLLMDRLHQANANARRGGHVGALMFIDLDNFKALNDTLGHAQGDLLLRQVAERLAGCVRAVDTVARLGGDEFVVLLEELSAQDGGAALQAQAVGELILAELNRQFRLAGRDHRCTPSIGVTLFAGHGSGIEEMLKHADLAMYQAKAAGRNTLRFFEPRMQTLVNTQVEMERELREALRHGDFELYYQAQVDRAGRITGAEALLRWNHRRDGLVPPDRFIALAEETGVILPLGQWVLEAACAQLAAWAALPAMRALSVAVNVSSRQFRQPDFVQQVSGAIKRSGADPRKLKFELTESLLLDDFADVIDKMRALKRRGVCFALDDFGVGYSSLSYLKRLPLDQLKIDRSFARDVLSNPNDAAIARVIVSLGHTLGLSIVAEGVETEAQRAFLANNQCNVFQGFLFSRPLPAAQFRDLVDAGAA
jgi:diguanylate cyclase (GGDEF)-like protein/PAS domain S-box-containing protein